MPDLLLDDVPEDLVIALEARASLNGRTAEEEHRAILEREFGSLTEAAD